MPIALIVAAAQNNTIGFNNKMPWYLPNELRYFKSITLGKPMIMGRKTFQSINSPLPERMSIVISSNPHFDHDGIHRVSSMEQALALAKQYNDDNNKAQGEIMVIGGAFTYAQALPLASRVYLTRIHRHIEGDTFFPELAPTQWQEMSREYIAADDDNPLDYSFLVYQRIANAHSHTPIHANEQP